jgi:predicted nucleic acid-binding Zn finger protein
MATGNVIAYVPSSSNPSVSYEVRLGKDGNVYCTCPNWKFQKLPPKERSCKHMKALSAQISTVTAKLAKAPVSAPVAKVEAAKAALAAAEAELKSAAA